MRRSPGLRGLVTGFALIGLFTAVLAGATSGPAHATVAAEVVPDTLPVFYGSLPASQTVVAINDTARRARTDLRSVPEKGMFFRRLRSRKKRNLSPWGSSRATRSDSR